MGIDIVIVDAGMPGDDVDFRLLLVACCLLAANTTEERRNPENKTEVRLFPGTLVVCKKELQKGCFWTSKTEVRPEMTPTDAKFWSWPARVSVRHEPRSENRGPFVYSHCNRRLFSAELVLRPF
jgi:hypothetical protein